MNKRSELFMSEIWKTAFVFQDIYNESDDDFKKYVDSLNEKELEEFINENHHSWYKGFDSGIAFNWGVVASAVARDTILPDNE